MRFSRAFLALTSLCFFLFSCDHQEQPGESPAAPDTPAAPAAAPMQTEVRTFEVTDSLGHSSGWGYDLFVNGKRTIHQDIVPAVSGNRPFRTEADARKTGELAAKKMQVTGSLPTISLHDLDSLQIAQ